NISSISEGNAAWSPVYSSISVGSVSSGPHLLKLAFDSSADQVESHDSAVTCLPKPMQPQFEANGSEPHKLPTFRSEGSSEVSQHLRSASVRQTCSTGVWAACLRTSAGTGPAVLAPFTVARAFERMETISFAISSRR